MNVPKLKVQELEVQEPELQGSELEGFQGGYLGALGWWIRLG